jgi:hypothetical protein
MSIAAWYANKAEKCAQMAKNAADVGERVRWATEARLWLEIGADFERDFELYPGPTPKSGRGRGGTGDAR